MEAETPTKDRRFKEYVIGALVGALVAFAGAWIGMPYLNAWRSELAFMNSEGDYSARCDAALRAAEALREAGDYDAARSWEEKGRNDCFLARHL
ncbi:MAG: hypothetical protein VYD90_13005 [Pseudomonadota bacterium]|uniref:hypothetical protein n=1 Tax=Novosphingobium sp. MBES04 TaxID=1206458 RepID=UPI001186A40D|nr:hypothetical protein [Novosphingobium sp. MBES04]MED5546161.1 hypothetical protein [Pseudomonadota bacterium]